MVEINGNQASHVVQYVTETFNQLLDDRAEKQRVWLECIYAYLCQFDKKWVEIAKAKKRSHRYVGVIFDSIETDMALISDILFGDDEWGRLLPMFPGGQITTDDEYAGIVEKYYRSIIKRSGFYDRADIAIKQMLCTGNCPWSHDWVKRKTADFKQYRDSLMRWNDDRVKYDEQYQAAMQAYNQIALIAQASGMVPPPPPDIPPPPPPPVDALTMFEGPVPVVGDIFNYVEELFPDDEDSAFRAHRSWKSKEWLRRAARPDEEGYQQFTGIEDIQGGDDRAAARSNAEEVMIQRAMGVTTTRPKPNDVELIHAEGTFEIPDGGTGQYRTYENYLAVVANGRRLIRFEQTPLITGKLTLHNAKLIRIRGSQYGIGIIEKALPEQDSVNAIHNQTIDAVHDVIEPEMIRVRDHNMMQPRGIGQVHEVNEPNGMVPVSKNYSGIPLGEREREAAIARVERLMAAVNVASGSSESATRTARNANIIQGKLGYWARMIERNLLQRWGQTEIEMLAQYVKKEQMFLVTQSDPKKMEWVSVSPEQIARGWLFEVAGTQYLMDKQERINNGLMFLQIGSQPVFVPAVNFPKILEMLCKDIMGRRSEGLVNTGPEVEAMMTQIALTTAGFLPPPQDPNAQQGDANGAPAA